MKGNTLPKRIWVSGSLDTINTSWPTRVDAYSCQALEAEPQRREFVTAETALDLLTALKALRVQFKALAGGRTLSASEIGAYDDAWDAIERAEGRK